MTEAAKWVPKRTLAECHKLICGPGAPLETHNIVVDGRVFRMYKAAPPSMRIWFQVATQTHAKSTYIVFENERYTYEQTFELASRYASIFRDVYGVHKGDRVAICMRNYAEWIISYWAAYLLGAVPVLVNAFVPGHVMAHCITHTTSKLIILDAERAAKLEAFLPKIQNDAGATGVIVVVKPHHDEKTGFLKTALKHGREWGAVLEKHAEVSQSKSWKKEPEATFADDGAIFFTSGTTGLPKGVLTTQLASIAAAFQPLPPHIRNILRRGEDFDPTKPPPTQRAGLLAIPLFHVTGCQALLLGTTMVGGKVVIMRKWNVKEAIGLIKNEGITTAGGVPSIALDLLDSDDFVSSTTSLEVVGYGGAPAPAAIPKGVGRLKGGIGAVSNGQGYGLTETSAGVISTLGDDSADRPLSTGIPLPTTDMLIIDSTTHKEAPIGTIGEIWIHGPQVMKGYWRNPKATEKVLTKDGWFNSEDLGYIDQDGFLYIKGRVKDLIIRGGENIDAVTVENALYDDDRVLSAAAVGVPDQRLGELPVVFVVLKHNAHATEEDLAASIKDRLPAFARPVMITILAEHMATNAAGKILKEPLRAKAKQLWEKRKKSHPKAKL